MIFTYRQQWQLIRKRKKAFNFIGHQSDRRGKRTF